MHRLTIYIATLLAAMFAACTHSEDPAPGGEVPGIPGGIATRTANVKLTVATNDDADKIYTNTITEAFREASAAETYIDFTNDNFQLYFFAVKDGDSEPTFVTKTTKVLAHDISTETSGEFYGKRVYEISARVLNLPTDREIRIMVLANWTTYPEAEVGVTTIDDICQHQKSVILTPGQKMPGLGQDQFLMPFYGIKKMTPVFDDSDSFDAGTIYLLRALAKVTLVCKSNSAYPLTKVEVVNTTSSFFMAPKNVKEESDYIKPNLSAPTIADNWDSGLNVHSASYTTSGPVSFKKVESPDYPYGAYILYLPEFDNKSKTDADNRCYLNLTFGADKDGVSGGTSRLDFLDYTDHTRKKIYDVHRNWWFHYSVTKSDPHNLTIDVAPYIGVELEANFGFERNEDGDILLTFPATPDDPHIVYTEYSEGKDGNEPKALYIELNKTRVYIHTNDTGYITFHVHEYDEKEEIIHKYLDVLVDDEGHEKRYLYIIVNGERFNIKEYDPNTDKQTEEEKK